jgi:hypothetical protein
LKTTINTWNKTGVKYPRESSKTLEHCSNSTLMAPWSKGGLESRSSICLKWGVLDEILSSLSWEHKRLWPQSEDEHIRLEKKPQKNDSLGPG